MPTGLRRFARRGSTVAVVLASSCAIVGVVASCSSDEELGTVVVDAGVEATTILDAAPADAGPADAPVVIRDAAPFDGGPLPIVCTSPPCAQALVTTVRSIVDLSSEDRDGFCALASDGTVACWGANGRGQLGRGDEAGAPDGPKPERVAGLTKVVQLEHTCALDEDGAIWCWGTGPYLENDAGAVTTARTPVKLPLPPATSMSVGDRVGCAVAAGKLLCWGSNGGGQIAPFEMEPSGAVLLPREIELPPGAPIRRVAVGQGTIVLREDGTALSWGRNPPIARVSSLDPDPYPDSVVLNDISSLDLTGDVACATSGGVGYCWGPARSFGVPRWMPVAVATPEPIVDIAVASVGRIRWCAVGASGAVYCFGNNAGGQAGDGTKDHAYTAVQVKDLPAPAAQVRVTQHSTCALLTNGKVHCWGTNYYGQLGSGALKEPSLVPQEVVLP